MMQRRVTQVFIVKIWKEKPEERNWRGQIQNVRSGQRVAAMNLSDLLEFFRHYLAEEPGTTTQPNRGLR